MTICFSVYLSLKDYIKADPTGRTVDTTLIVQVKQGSEPFKFRGCFIDWDPKRWAVSDFFIFTYEICV